MSGANSAPPFKVATWAMPPNAQRVDRNSAPDPAGTGGERFLHSFERNRGHQAEQQAKPGQKHLRKLHRGTDFEALSSGGAFPDKAAVWERKLTPKNLTNEASVRALVRIATIAQNAK